MYGASVGCRSSAEASESAIAIGGDPGTDHQTFGFNAFSTPLKAGTHTVTVLWHTFPDGATSCVEERSLIVLHP
jgi:hypothetical protein